MEWQHLVDLIQSKENYRWIIEDMVFPYPARSIIRNAVLCEDSCMNLNSPGP
jgi:hypothetical protein